MPNSPRKPNSPRPPKDAPSPQEDLFESAAPTPGTPAAPSPSADEDWQLEEPAGKPADAPAKPRLSSLPTQPIPAPSASAASFESNAHIPSAVPLKIPRHSAPVPAPTPPPAPSKPVPQDSSADPFDIDDELTLETRPKSPPAPLPSPADSPQPRYDLGKLTSTKSVAAALSKSAADPGNDLSEDPGSAPSPSSQSDHPDDSDSNSDSATDREPGTAPAPPGLGSKAGLLSAAAILVILIAIFAGVLYSHRPSAPPGTAKSAPSLPITGKLVTLTEVTSGWRARQQGDLASPVDVVLPTATRLQSEFLPQVQFTFDPAATKPGFLRFIFLDPDRKISGDVRVMKLANGTIEPLSSGAIVNGPGATVYGSFGFLDRPAFVSYASNTDQRWSVEISESSDYNAKEKDWTLLETFDIRNASLP